MPYSVGHLLENQANITVVRKTDQIVDALDLMIKHEYSQLPVVDEKNLLLGMITHEGIMRAIRSFNTTLDRLLVRDALISAPSYFREDDLFDLLDELKNTNAVIIIEPGGFVVGIVTSYDTSEFLRDRTEDLMHIEDIEFTIKELLKEMYAGKGEWASDKFRLSATELYELRSEQLGSRKPKAFEDLTLADYINLLVSKETWEFFAPILAIQKESLCELLEKVRQTRNDLAHFRGEISARSRDELKYCANWLRSRYRDYEKGQERDFLDTLLKQNKETKTAVRAVQEGTAVYETNLSVEKNPGRSRYAALADWLTQQKEKQVSLNFEQIEGILRSPLPASALALRAWWANDAVGHHHSILWLEVGWKVTYVDLAEKQVIFSRVTPNKDAPFV